MENGELLMEEIYRATIAVPYKDLQIRIAERLKKNYPRLPISELYNLARKSLEYLTGQGNFALLEGLVSEGVKHAKSELAERTQSLPSHTNQGYSENQPLTINSNSFKGTYAGQVYPSGGLKEF